MNSINMASSRANKQLIYTDNFKIQLAKQYESQYSRGSKEKNAQC